MSINSLSEQDHVTFFWSNTAALFSALISLKNANWRSMGVTEGKRTGRTSSRLKIFNVGELTFSIESLFHEMGSAYWLVLILMPTWMAYLCHNIGQLTRPNTILENYKQYFQLREPFGPWKMNVKLLTRDQPRLGSTFIRSHQQDFSNQSEEWTLVGLEPSTACHSSERPRVCTIGVSM